jgi:hypothetical protein
MPPEQPPPIPPIDYASPQPAPPKRSNIFLVIIGILLSRTTRVIYLILCSIGLLFVVRFLLHYRQMLEDAMKMK